MERLREKPNPWAALRAAFPATVPVLTGFLCLGVAYGLLMQTNGYGPLWSTLMSAIGFGGSMQYVAITLLVSAFDPLQAFLLALMVNARHVFYGLSMLDKYKGLGKARFFLVFALCDETFSLVSTLDPPEGVKRRDFYLWITLLDFLYWVAATALAALLAVPGGPGAAGGGDVSGQGPAPRHHGAAAPLEEQRAPFHRRRHGGVYASGAGDLCLTDFPRINPSRPAQNGTAARGRGSFFAFQGGYDAETPVFLGAGGLSGDRYSGHAAALCL